MVGSSLSLERGPKARKTIDFLIIGAAKGGTTSAFHYLSAHPAIYMPQRKEISFFSRTRDYEKGIDWCLNEWFREASGDSVWGEASPAYMYYDEVPGRIRKTLPGVRLIALLRNPIERAHSHFQMGYRKGLETGTFEDCVDQLLSRPAEAPMRILKGFHADYLRYGQYARILKQYLDAFPREQLRVYFYETFTREPRQVIDDVWRWLGLPNIETEIFQRRFNVGGRARFPRLGKLMGEVYRFGLTQEWAKRLATTFVSKNRLVGTLCWLNNEFNVKRETSPPLTASMRVRLRDFYQGDVERLQQLLGVAVPWADFHPE